MAVNSRTNNLQDKSIVEYTDASGVTIKNLIEVCTRPSMWQNTPFHVVLPFSIHSTIYEGITGELKIKALLQHVQSHAQGKALILLSEGAHLNALSIKYNDINTALDICRNDANNLLERFKNYFKGFEINFWEEFIFRHKNYHRYKNEIMNFYTENNCFHHLVKSDAEKMYSAKMSKEYPDKDLFIHKTQLDMLEMLIGCKIMGDENYQVHIYPGATLASAKHLQSTNYLKIIFITAHIKVKKLAPFHLGE